MNSIRNEIEKYFSMKTGNGAYKIESLKDEFPAWVLRDGKSFGVFVKYDGEDIAESFSEASLISRSVNFEQQSNIKILCLSCSENILRNEFSFICADFVSPGTNGEKRKNLLKTPMNWWQGWRQLLGDAQKNMMVYDIVGELMAVVKLYRMGKKPYWSATGLSSHDIELDNSAYEVKSTLQKEKTSVHISSQFQLTGNKPLYLVFTRLEKSLTGYSIDDLMEQISRYDSGVIKKYNKYLEEKGFLLGNHGRKEKYVLLERRKLVIDDNFPKITPEMFSGGKIPNNISHIEYDVSLDGLMYEDWR